jgi:hypothetical protein
MSSEVRYSPSGNEGVAAGSSRASGVRNGVTTASAGAGRTMAIIVIVLTTAVAAVWSLVGLRQLTSSIARENTEHLEHARKTFESMRARTLENLRAHARVMVEDPRLKSTLATDGVDEATVADILGDIGKLRRTGFLIVLTPEGRVFAQSGADELRGLDLSGSSAVKKAQSTVEATVGSWVIGGKIFDLSLMPVRFGGAAPIAYLVVGQAVDQDLLNAVSDQTGVAVATATGSAIMLSAPADDVLKPVFATVAGQAESAQSRLFEINGESYVAAIAELEETGQSRPRLVLVQSLARTADSFGTIKWMFFVPPVLVLIAVLFAMTANRRVVVVRQP